MIYPDVPLEEWIEKYGLMVVPFTCPKCKGEFQTTVPILMKDVAGLESPIHGCGPSMTKVILTPRAERERLQKACAERCEIQQKLADDVRTVAKERDAERARSAALVKALEKIAATGRPGPWYGDKIKIAREALKEAGGSDE